MVINRSDLKRKKKDEENLLDESPKRTKVHAQRKFAQGTLVNSSPILTPIREMEKSEKSRSEVLPEPEELLPMKRPQTEDFLTFLCFRGTSMLPPALNFFSSASTTDSVSENGDSPISQPQSLPLLPSCSIHNAKSEERPFIAFGVRKRADPVLISKQMDKKRRHALALQALRRKYQEQRMAKIRAVTISQLSEKVTSKSLVRTRSITKNETSLKKNVTQKTRVKVVSSTKTALKKQPVTVTVTPQRAPQVQKKRMCLRSFRGRFNHQELQVKANKTFKRKPLRKNMCFESSEESKKPKISVKCESKSKKCEEEEEEEEASNNEEESEFSSDDEKPLTKSSRRSSLRLTGRYPMHVVEKTVTSQKNSYKSTKDKLTPVTRSSFKTTRSKILRTQQKTQITKCLNSSVKLANRKMPSYPVLRRHGLLKSNEVRKTRNMLSSRKSEVVLKPRSNNIKSINERKTVSKFQSRKTGMETRRTKIESKEILKQNDEKRNVKKENDNKSGSSPKIIKKQIKTEKQNNFSNDEESKPDSKSKISVKNEVSENDKKENIVKKSVSSDSETKPKKVISDNSTCDLKVATRTSSDKNSKPVQKLKLHSDDKKLSKDKVTVEECKVSQRPSRKTKEAAAIYMEILGHKLINDKNFDEDNISIDSFPELPNVRKTEQRENELKAKAKTKVQKSGTRKSLKNEQSKQVLTKSCKESEKNCVSKGQNKNESFTLKNEQNNEDKKKKNISSVNRSKVTKEGEVLSVENSSKLSENEIKDNEKVKTPTPKIKQSKETDAKDDSVKKSGSCEDVEKRKDEPVKSPYSDLSAEKIKILNEKKAELGLVSTKNEFLSDSDDKSNKTVSKTKKKKLTKIRNQSITVKSEEDSTDSEIDSKRRNKNQIKLQDSFSDSDEEPLSKLTKSKESKKNVKIGDSETKNLIEKNTESLKQESKVIRNSRKTATQKNSKKKVEEQTEQPTYSKPKRECTKRPSNYLTMFSSSDDDDKYFHGFVKSENIKQSAKEEKKSVQVAASADLLCKDVDKRFGKGKVNMSTEQIEKWIKESALAGSDIKKEEEEEEIFGKFEEKIPTDTSLTNDIQESLDIKVLKTKLFPESDTSKDNVSLTNTEDNVKVKVPPKPIEKDKKCVVTSERKTIFRKEKKENKPNSNAFSPENESSVYAFEAENEDIVSTPFRRPVRRPSSTATSKSEDETSKLEDLKTCSTKFRLPLAVKHDSIKSCNKEESLLQNNLESTEKNKQETVNKPVNEGVTFTKVTCVTDSQKDKEDKSIVSMFPPSQKSKTNDVKFQRSKSSDEDFRYKIPSSPSASSSSSTKVYKKNTIKTRTKNIEICTPVRVTDFPKVSEVPQIVEAPVFYPNDKEFQDPLEYIEKIRQKAEKFGICRIVPPSHFKPECKVSDEMRFTAYNQLVHKMLHRWGPNLKELMAIKKYLQTQSINLTHPPWIGGIEVDLPRLYQTVQSLGGLKEVIEKKRWSKVSEVMRIPKSAQDRVTKLDDIYCKYLLPYDTLSPVERQKLFDEVETEWAKRESRILSKSQEKNDNQDDNLSDQSEEESDDEVDECIVKGRNMALNTFYRIARNTMSMWFKTPDPSAEEVEQEFWKHVNTRQCHICVHSGSIDSGNWGYGFAVTKNSPFARHAWNLKVLTNNNGSILRSMGPVMGVTVPTLHVGMVFTGCCWYRDPHHLPWIEYLHTGGSKIWYSIPDSMSDIFRTTLNKLMPNYCHNKTIWLPSDTVMVPPSLLVKNGISLCRTVQEPGHYIVVFPKAFTSNICTGYVVSESVYFATPSWLKTAQKVFDDMRDSSEPSMFSLDRLILSVAMDSRSHVDVLRQVVPKVEEICKRETSFRKKAREIGINKLEKISKPEGVDIRKRRKMQNESGDYECDICRANLFVSWPLNTVKDCPQASTSKEDLPKQKTVSTEKNLPREEQIHSSKTVTPAQDECKKRISVMESSLNSLLLQRDSGLSTPGLDKEIKKLKEKIETEKKSLKRKESAQQRSSKSRAMKKRKLDDICLEHPDVAEKLKIRSNPGRPSLEEDQPDILQTIMKIAIFGSSADERRRTETIRSCKNLDQLHEQLKSLGFQLSRSATYLRLLPRNSSSREGKRHVSTVPVKLIRAQNDLKKKHIDTEFATTSIRYLESLASFLGPNEVFFLSQDDKARVPIGLTAASKQAPLLMHMQYRVSLPDHDWVVAAGHKLIPSVYAGIVIEPNGFGNPSKVTYSGPTFIAIRSGKHSSSTANTHSNDFKKIFELESFKSLAYTNTGSTKPVVIISADGGPDENPRYGKVIFYAIQHFRDFNLDALFVVTNAPGRSAYNRAERRMAPLSHELAGLILPHEHYGSHLDSYGKTIDKDLEKKNFEYAGTTLASVWKSLKVDGYDVDAEYIAPKEDDSDNVQIIIDDWYCKHVRESQYLLQILKCSNEDCCGQTRSSLRSLIPDGFLPPPIKLQQTENRLIVSQVNSEDGTFINLFARLAVKLQPEAADFQQIPYDWFCPSVHDKLANRTCKECSLYHTSNKTLLQHLKNLHPKKKRQDEVVRRIQPTRIAARRARELLCILGDENAGTENAEWIDDDEVDGSFENVEEDVAIPIIDVSEHLQNPWTSDK